MEENVNKEGGFLSDTENVSKIMSVMSNLSETVKTAQTETKTEPEISLKSEETDLPESTVQEAETEEKTAGLSEESANSLASMLPVILSALGGSGNELKQSGKERLNLLLAVKPFLQETHRQSIDRAAGLVKAAQAARSAFGGLTENLFK